VVRQGGRVAFPNGVEPEPKQRSGIEIVSYAALSGVREFEQSNEASGQYPGRTAALCQRCAFLKVGF
jgi:hypothetical protein